MSSTNFNGMFLYFSKHRDIKTSMWAIKRLTSVTQNISSGIANEAFLNVERKTIFTSFFFGLWIRNICLMEKIVLYLKGKSKFVKFNKVFMDENESSMRYFLFFFPRAVSKALKGFIGDKV